VHQAGRDGLRSALMVELTLDAACMLISVGQLHRLLGSGLVSISRDMFSEIGHCSI
jgi:hypothetical protein